MHGYDLSVNRPGNPTDPISAYNNNGLQHFGSMEHHHVDSSDSFVPLMESDDSSGD